MIRSENNQSVLPQITRYWDQRAQGYALQVDDEFKESLQDVYLPWFESVVSEGSVDRKSTRLNSSHPNPSRMPSSA